MDVVNRCEGKLTGGATYSEGIKGKAFDLNGKRAAIQMPDIDAYKFTGSFSLDLWIYVRELPSGGTSPAGQILFRGDDRNGLDPYFLAVSNDGYLIFGIDAAEGSRFTIQTIAPVRRWAHITATFDIRERGTALYIDDALRASGNSSVRPFRDLDSGWGPALSIGNVQRQEAGIHNQPFNGLIDEIRIYEGVIQP